jgi:hypothetical protein
MERRDARLHAEVEAVKRRRVAARAPPKVAASAAPGEE